MSNCIIVIPVHKSTPSEDERQAFRRMLSVLRNHDIAMVTHEECDLREYEEIATETGKTFGKEYFDKGFFKSVDDYNRLCFDKSFYTRFSGYEYMLICQVDVWVFSDQLDYWCEQGYDYIGAPIYFPYNTEHFTRVFDGIGNGGFCLRRISHCLKMIESDRERIFLKPRALARIYWYSFLYNETYTKNIAKRLGLIPLLVVKVFGFRNTIGRFLSQHTNEDMIFGTWANASWGHSSKVPDELTAARFSIEVNPEWLYGRIGNTLPFACHAYRKWEYDSFWRKHIKEGIHE